MTADEHLAWLTPDDFDRIGNDANAWLTYANALWDAAQRLRSSTTCTLPDGMEVMPTSDQVAAMLLGYATECALKGLWVNAGHVLAAQGRLTRIPHVGHHDLLALARAVGIEASREELAILNRLAVFIVFAGRYPISTAHDAMQPRRVGSEDAIAPGFFGHADFAIAERVFLKLRSQLRYRVVTP